MRFFATVAFLFSILGAALLSGCSRLVDEDISDCGKDLNVNYELQLVTNMRTEIKTVLDLQADLQVATALENHLVEVFSDFAHDVGLSFYDTAGDEARLEHFDVVMDGSQSSYSLFIPARPYTHLCVANQEAEPYVTLEGDGQCKTSRLVQHPEVQDTVCAHTTGIFTARTKMDIQAGIDQRFDVSLYMVNAATALVLDMSDAPEVKDFKVYLRGMADGFMLADSTYTFDSNPVIRTTLLPVEAGGTERCYVSTHFPSRDVDVPSTKLIIDIEDPEGGKLSEEVLWYWEVYVTLPDGTTTKSVLGSYNPLHAAQLKIVKGVVRKDGSTEVTDKTMGVSVTLDWEPGTEHNFEL